MTRVSEMVSLSPENRIRMRTDHQNRRTIYPLLENGLVALCAAGTFLLICWLLKYSAYGIDFTDESFYLVWIADPFIYNGSITQFGFVYHPLYRLLGDNIAALRQANILITFALAWGLTYSFFSSLAANLKENRLALLVISAAVATCSFTLFDSWLPTPNYNSLNLQALLVTATGLVLAKKHAYSTSIYGWVLVGLGGGVAFLAKPSTALALAIGVTVYFLLARFSIRMFFIPVTCALALLVFCAVMVDGSVADFIKRYQVGIESASHLGGGHTLRQILRVDSFHTNKEFKLGIVLLSSAVFLAFLSLCAKNKWFFIGPLISVALFILTALLTLGHIHRTANFGEFQGLLIFAVVFAVVTATFALGRMPVLKTIPVQQWALATLFLVLPHLYAFGTNGNYWKAGSSAAIFWLLSGLTLFASLIRARESWLFALPAALAVQAVTATLLQTGLEQPYRQPQPLRINSSTLEIGPQRSLLTLSEGFSTYIASAVNAAETAGFVPNTPVIDLTGQSPGILYFLKARSIGQAWMIGGYPGSLKLAETALGRTPCEEISAAWILHEKDGPRAIPTELMLSLGADFPNNYRQVGTWTTAGGAGGYKAPRTQDLYRPIEPQKTLMTCKKLREGSKQ